VPAPHPPRLPTLPPPGALVSLPRDGVSVLLPKPVVKLLLLPFPLPPPRSPLRCQRRRVVLLNVPVSISPPGRSPRMICRLPPLVLLPPQPQPPRLRPEPPQRNAAPTIFPLLVVPAVRNVLRFLLLLVIERRVLVASGSHLTSETLVNVPTASSLGIGNATTGILNLRNLGTRLPSGGERMFECVFCKSVRVLRWVIGRP